MAVTANAFTTHGTFDVTINADVFTVRSYDFNPDGGVTLKSVMDNQGQVKGDLIVSEGRASGSMVLEYDNDPPTTGDEFTAAIDGVASGDYTIYTPAVSRSAGEAGTISLNFVAKMA